MMVDEAKTALRAALSATERATESAAGRGGGRARENATGGRVASCRNAHGGLQLDRQVIARERSRHLELQRSLWLSGGPAEDGCESLKKAAVVR